MWPFKSKLRRETTDWYENIFSLFDENISSAEDHINQNNIFAASRNLDKASALTDLIQLTFPDRITVREGDMIGRWNTTTRLLLDVSKDVNNGS